MTMQEFRPYQGERSTSGFGARDFSPDSVIFTAESNFSLLSSASASVDRCSFASDVLDQDSPASDTSQHLADQQFHDASNICRPHVDRDPNKIAGQYWNTGITKAKSKVQQIGQNENENETEDGNLVLDSGRNSFSKALKECQFRRSRSEATMRKTDMPRPASVDPRNCMINLSNSSSPRFGGMKKPSFVIRHNGTFPSPGTPFNLHTGLGVQKGWSSERVPLHNSSHRRNLNTALLPYNNGKALPSKWEDAERWVLSPVSVDGAVRHSVQQPQRRPKSKSGPLGPPGTAYNAMYSPTVLMLNGSNVANQIENSPFSAGVMMANGLSIRHGGYLTGGNFSASVEPCMERSVSIHGCSELISQSSSSSNRDEKLDGIICSNSVLSHAVPRRDMATQMSPEGSPQSSSSRKPSCAPSTPSVIPIVELQSAYSPKPKVRDVQVDEQVIVTRWSKKQSGRVPLSALVNSDDWKRKAVEIQSSHWDISETAKKISKSKREEAKINAWENLQKAKAEAAIHKLEIKLERSRSSSMDKIMNKLKSAQKKAQSMRSSIAGNQAHQIARSSSRRALSFRRTRQIGSLSGCFTCHAF